MEEINIKELYNYIISKFYIILIFVGICFILGNIYSLFIQKPLYQSNTSLVLVSDNSITQSDVQLNNNLVYTYSEIIKSRSVLTQVINNLNLDYKVEQLTNNISVSSVTNTQLIKVVVTDRDKVKAKDIANEIAKVFTQEVNKKYKIQNVSIIDYAEVADSAYNINPLKQNLMYILVGFVLGFGVVFIIFYFDTTIKDTSVIEDKMQLTVLGVVPKVGDSNAKK